LGNAEEPALLKLTPHLLSAALLALQRLALGVPRDPEDWCFLPSRVHRQLLAEAKEAGIDAMHFASGQTLTWDVEMLFRWGLGLIRLGVTLDSTQTSL